MPTAFLPRTLVLFAGDLVTFMAALWLSLFLRSFEVPPQWLFVAHVVPFSLLFVVWVVVFFVAGLYENRSIILARRAFSATLLVAQVVNLIITALFFFFVPAFGIAPKTLLFIYLPVSFVLILVWRVFLFPLLGIQKPEQAIVVGEGAEIEELVVAMHNAHRAPVVIAEVVAPHGELGPAIVEAMERHRARVVLADFNDPRVSRAFPQVYNLLAVGVRFFDALAVYEDVFGRIPLSLLDDKWVARNISSSTHTLYDTLKRLMDVCISLPVGLVSLVVYPFLAPLIKLQDGGPVFIWQERVGETGKKVWIPKFRSMERNDTDLTSASHKTNRVTPMGKFIRATRLDELPQLWSVLRGDLSLIGPRPELPSGVALYEREIPYYGIRHLIKPGLSGWALLYQTNDPHHGAAIAETRTKLSYDLYYLKHRSLLLDITIALKTIKKLLTRSGV